LRIAIAHSVLKIAAKKHNIDRIRRIVREARMKGAKAIILPSMINYGPFVSFMSPVQAKNTIKNHAERIPMGSTINTLTHLASSHGLFILTGPMIERAGPRVFLTSVAISPTGIVISKYRKIVLDPGDKNLGISSGKSFMIVNLKEKIGIMSENDIFYPEIARGLLLNGATVFTAFLRIEPAFDDRIRKVLEARSIENNVPVIAIGGVAKGHEQILGETPSLIIDPVEGILEEIRLLSDNTLEQEEKVVLLELKGNISEDKNKKMLIKELNTILYKNLKKNKH